MDGVVATYQVEPTARHWNGSQGVSPRLAVRTHKSFISLPPSGDRGSTVYTLRPVWRPSVDGSHGLLASIRRASGLSPSGFHWIDRPTFGISHRRPLDRSRLALPGVRGLVCRTPLATELVQRPIPTHTDFRGAGVLLLSPGGAVRDGALCRKTHRPKYRVPLQRTMGETIGGMVLGLLGEFRGIASSDPISAVLLFVGAILLGVTMVVGVYLATGAAVGPVITRGPSGREHPPPNR